VQESQVNETQIRAALNYHSDPKPGKIEIVPTKPVETRADLALAYTPGVGQASMAIANDPAQAARLTGRSNLIAVVSDGTAVLGLGNIGALASKPVMEGKSVLFKLLGGINAFDIEVDTRDPDHFVDVVAALEPTFGGINLEDIKAPECFEIEERLKARLKIPVMHDDQHGTAVVVAAALRNALLVTGRDIATTRLVCVGAGASAIACLDLLVEMGLPRPNICMLDSGGLVHRGRNGLNKYKARFAQDTDLGGWEQVMQGADVLLCLSGPGSVDPVHLQRMAARPVVMALANPTPEIMPEIILAERPDAVVCTGRSDYPNQVNNALGFPYIFRAALDCGATAISEEMKLACAMALSDLARETPPGIDQPGFGPLYLIPDVLDPRLLPVVASAVALAAERSNVAQRPIADIEAYKYELETQYGALKPKKTNQTAQSASANVGAETPAPRQISAALA
jgi:malate dehydrogenase (oxaloacetate-decarboxylating)(NADP+)